MASCAICTNELNRKYDRHVRVGYLVNVSKEVSKLFTCEEGRNPHANYTIKVCSQCRFDLLGAVRLWIKGSFVSHEGRNPKSGPDSFERACPCCGFVEYDGRTLRIAGLQGIDQLHSEFRVEKATGFLTTCRDCRGEFLHDVLTGWVCGGFTKDLRSTHFPFQEALSENGTLEHAFRRGVNGLSWNIGGAPSGARIDLFIEEMLDLSKIHGQTLVGRFNGCTAVVHPSDELSDALKRFDEEWWSRKSSRRVSMV